jgi:hypothetical protein
MLQKARNGSLKKDGKSKEEEKTGTMKTNNAAKQKRKERNKIDGILLTFG